jgi:malonyl-CoA O-methyltransferase
VPSVTLRLDDALPEKRATRRAFDAAEGFEEACFLHDDARSRLLARLDYVALSTPRLVIDLGCATGRGANALALRYPDAQVVALDTSARMLERAASQAGAHVAVVGGDAERLPICAHRADLVLANLVLPWCRPDAVFAETARVLKEGGLVLFATLGPDTLKEVREAFGAVDGGIHVHAAFDLHDLGDMVLAGGLAEPVLDVDRLEVTYPDVAALVRDLRAIGAVNVAGARRRGLTGIERWRGFTRGFAAVDGRLAVTIELIFGQAFGRGVVRRLEAAAPGEIRVPLERLRRRSENT